MLDGDTMDPSVSVPTAAAHKFAAVAAPDPELDPDVLRSNAYGLRVKPPRPDHPDVECVDRKLAHSLRLVLPRITAPASRRRFTIKASAGGLEPARASDPAVVIMLSAVAMLSLISTGMPCSGPRGPRLLRSASWLSAVVRASGFSSMMLCRDGPALALSMAAMRARYFSANVRAVSRPEAMRCCRSAMVASSRSNFGVWAEAEMVRRAASQRAGNRRKGIESLYHGK